MIPDSKNLKEQTKSIEHYYAPQSEEWGQPPASNYFFTIIDNVMYGQITGTNYLSTYQNIDSLLIEKQITSELENNGWLALAASAFEFWDNEQDAIFDNL